MIVLVIVGAAALGGYIAGSYIHAVLHGRGRQWRRHFRDAWERN